MQFAARGAAESSYLWWWCCSPVAQGSQVPKGVGKSGVEYIPSKSAAAEANSPRLWGVGTHQSSIQSAMSDLFWAVLICNRVTYSMTNPTVASPGVVGCVARTRWCARGGGWCEVGGLCDPQKGYSRGACYPSCICCWIRLGEQSPTQQPFWDSTFLAEVMAKKWKKPRNPKICIHD